MEDVTTTATSSSNLPQVIELVRRRYGRACREDHGAEEALGDVVTALNEILDLIENTIALVGKADAALAALGYAAHFSTQELDALILAAGELHDGGENDDLSAVQLAALDRAAQLHRDRFAVDDQ